MCSRPPPLPLARQHRVDGTRSRSKQKRHNGGAIEKRRKHNFVKKKATDKMFPVGRPVFIDEEYAGRERREAQAVEATYLGPPPDNPGAAAINYVRVRSLDDGDTRAYFAGHVVPFGRYFKQRATMHPECATNVEVRCRECRALVEAVLRMTLARKGQSYAAQWRGCAGGEPIDPFVLTAEDAARVAAPVAEAPPSPDEDAAAAASDEVVHEEPELEIDTPRPASPDTQPM